MLSRFSAQWSHRVHEIRLRYWANNQVDQEFETKGVEHSRKVNEG